MWSHDWNVAFIAWMDDVLHSAALQCALSSNDPEAVADLVIAVLDREEAAP